MYPVKVPIFRWKSMTSCQIVCRQDALVEICFAILTLDNSLTARVGSVEHVGNDILSFLITVDPVPLRLKAGLESVIEPFRTQP